MDIKFCGITDDYKHEIDKNGICIRCKAKFSPWTKVKFNSMAEDIHIYDFEFNIRLINKDGYWQWGITDHGRKSGWGEGGFKNKKKAMKHAIKSIEMLVREKLRGK